MRARSARLTRRHPLATRSQTLSKEPPAAAVSPADAPRCLGAAGDVCDLIDLGVFPDRSGQVGEVSVLRCRTCGAGQSRPPLSDVAFLYADRTSQEFQPRTGALARTMKNVFFSAQARRLLAAAASAAGAPPKLIVDFACGSGLFTTSLARAAGGARVVGVDFHSSPPPDLTGADYRPMGQIDALRGQADLVLAMHVLEHDDDPTALLVRIAALARPGAAVVVETPNIDCFWTPVFGRAWDAWYLPYHRTHFTRRSLRTLVEAAGLAVLREQNVSVPSLGRTIANLLGRRNGLLFIGLGAGLYPVQWAAEWLTGRPVAIRVIARKP